MDLEASTSTAKKNGIYSQIITSFQNDVIKEVLKTHNKNSKNKITEEAVDLISEITKALVVEAALRAAKQAACDNEKTVSLKHVEIVLPQLILDFP